MLIEIQDSKVLCPWHGVLCTSDYPESRLNAPDNKNLACMQFGMKLKYASLDQVKKEESRVEAYCCSLIV